MSTYKRGQASLEMVVGLIILLVVAGVVIGLVMTTMNKENMTSVTGGAAGKFVDNCKAFCETKDYMSYCTSTMNSITQSTDWNRDNTLGGLVKDKVSVWDFCEDRVYCFLVTDCSTLGTDPIDGCRKYMCQQYEKKYGDTQKAALKLREVYKISDDTSKCCRKERTGPDTCIGDLSKDENWLQKGFNSQGWCTGGDGSVNGCNRDGVCDCAMGESQDTCTDCGPNDCVNGGAICGMNGCEPGETFANCPQDCTETVKISLGNCTYMSADDSMVCDTNCLGTVAGQSTKFVVIDKNSNMSMAMDGDTVVGSIVISGGKVTATPDAGLAGSSVKLSGLDPDFANWMATINCKNPAGTGKIVSGITKQ